MTNVDLRTGIEIIDRDECLRLLASQSLGRLALVENGRPHLVPVNFVLDGDAVVFRTDVGTKLDASSRSVVVFEVDGIDESTRSGWSVIVHGLAHEVTRLDRVDLQQRLARLALHPWAPGEKSHVVRIVPTSITGRRVRPAHD